MQDPIIKQETDPIPDEDAFRQALLQIERFASKRNGMPKRPPFSENASKKRNTSLKNCARA